MKLFKTLLFLGAACLLAVVLYGVFPGSVSVKVSMSWEKTKEILIGEKVPWKVRVYSPRRTEVEIREAAETPKYLEKTVKRSHRVFLNREVTTADYLFYSFTPGTYTLDPWTIRTRNAGEKAWKEIKIAPFSFTVKSLLPKEASGLDIRDIKGPLATPRYVLMISSGLFLLALAFCAYFLRRRMKRAETEKPPPAPHLLALQRLKDLEKKDLVSRGLLKEFYTQLSLIMRHYLEDRFLIRAPEMTTEEFLYFLKDACALSTLHKALLKDFLYRSDMVKFARYDPRDEEAYASLSAAKKLIEETKSEEQPSS